VDGAANRLQDSSADNITSTINTAYGILLPLSLGSATKSDPTAKVWVRRFKTPYARYLAEDVNILGFPFSFKQYPQPRLYRELADRAARSWCGMRSAAAQQGSKSNLQMLDHSLVSIFNDLFALGLTKSNVTMAPMDPVQTTATGQAGAQAFLIPFAFA